MLENPRKTEKKSYYIPPLVNSKLTLIHHSNHPTPMNIHKKLLSIALYSLSSSATLLNAEDFAFTKNDLLLAVRATSGSGTTTNIYFNLGSVMSFRDGTNPTNLGNIDADLKAEFDNNWYERTDLRFGVAGNRTNLTTQVDPPDTLIGEDPGRVWYIGHAAASPGAATLRALMTGNSLGFAATNYGGLKGIFEQGSFLETTLQKTASGAAILKESEQPTRWKTSWSQLVPASDDSTAFTQFTGGVQATFGQSGSQVVLDVHRMVGGQIGTYVTSIVIGNDGSIRALEPTPTATPIETWVATFPALVSSPNAADRTPAGDFDKDGIPNIREFAFGGSPVSASDNGQQQLRTVDANGDSQGDLTLTVEVRSGATFTTSGNKLTANRDGVIYTIEGSLDLVTFESAVSEVTPTLGTGTPKAGYVFKTFRLNASAGLSGRGFIRGGAAVAP